MSKNKCQFSNFFFFYYFISMYRYLERVLENFFNLISINS